MCAYIKFLHIHVALLHVKCRMAITFVKYLLKFRFVRKYFTRMQIYPSPTSKRCYTIIMILHLTSLEGGMIAQTLLILHRLIYCEICLVFK